MGTAAYHALRKAIVEPVFGQIKGGRHFRRFSFRGLGKVRAEWLLICLTHNLLKLFRVGWTPHPALSGGTGRSGRGADSDCARTIGRPQHFDRYRLMLTGQHQRDYSDRLLVHPMK